MRLRCANSISIFLRSRRECANASVLARSRVTSRAASLTSRTTRHAGIFGQHFALSGHARHSGLAGRAGIAQMRAAADAEKLETARLTAQAAAMLARGRPPIALASPTVRVRGQG
jgi:hypothetical protein